MHATDNKGTGVHYDSSKAAIPTWDASPHSIGTVLSTMNNTVRNKADCIPIT